MKQKQSSPLMSFRHHSIAVGVGLILGLMAFSFVWAIHKANNDSYHLDLKERVMERASALRSRLEQNLNARLLLVDGLAAYVTSGSSLTQESFQALAKSMTVGRKDIRALELAPNGIVKFVYPITGNENAVNLDLRTLPGQSDIVKRTIKDKLFLLAGPLDLVQGGRAIIGRKPIFVSDAKGNESFWGFAIIVIDFEALMQKSSWPQHGDITFALRGKDGHGANGDVFLGPKDTFSRNAPILQDIALPNGSWQLAGVPSQNWEALYPKELAYKIGAYIAFVLTFLILYWGIRLSIQRNFARTALVDSERKYGQMIEAVNVITWELDLATWRFTYVSPHAESLFGYPCDEWKKENFWVDHLYPDDKDQALSFCLKKCEEKQDHNFEYRMIAADKSVVWVRNIVTVGTDEHGAGFLHGTMINITDIKQAENALKASLNEKEVMLKEIHHRVKNNLQVVSSLLSLQSESEKNKHVIQALQESERRVQVMARAHENLYSAKDLAYIHAKIYLGAIVEDAKLFHGGVDLKNVSFREDIDNILLNIDQALPLGQILSELLSNVFKHALSRGNGGTVKVSFKRCDKGCIELMVADDGVGLPEGFDFNDTSSLGLRLVRALTDKLDGKIEIDGSCGTKISLVFEGI